MVKKIVDTKVRTLIKAFLVFNKGKKYTAKEICDWINNNSFALNQCSVDPKAVSYHVRGARYNNAHMLYDVRVEKVGSVNHYWVEA